MPPAIKSMIADVGSAASKPGSATAAVQAAAAGTASACDQPRNTGRDGNRAVAASIVIWHLRSSAPWSVAVVSIRGASLGPGPTPGVPESRSDGDIEAPPLPR